MKSSVFIKSILLGIPIGVTIFDTVGYVAKVEGVSMQPAFNPGSSDTDYVLLNRWSVRNFDVTRGEIVSLLSPKDRNQTIIKRVVGLEGDVIRTVGYKSDFVRVPEGHIWVEGDHKRHSLDSNSFGPVSLGLVTAKAQFIVWPPSRWRNIKPEVQEEFELKGNVLSHALGLGDIDNDGNNELIIGNINGELTIFKEDREWQKICSLGMITAIGVGDVFNIGCNALVVVCGDGWCHILLMSSNEKKDQEENKLESVHVQRIPANTKVVLLGDVDGDGCVELVLGLTDRVVRSYRWLAEPTEGGEERQVSGRLVGLHKWECANQIGTVTLNYSADGTPCLLVAQPGGTFMKIHCSATSKENTEDIASTSVDYHPLTSSRMRNPNVSTEILGCIRPPGIAGDDKTSMRYVVATLDGTLMLVQNEQVLWSIQVDHQLFALNKLDVTGDGVEEIVACSWDGQTYILDQNKSCVRFQLEESVRGFCCGYYTLHSSKSPTPVFVYNTFMNKLYIFYDINLDSMVVSSGQNLVRSVAPQLNRRSSQLLMEWCLYGRTT